MGMRRGLVSLIARKGAGAISGFLPTPTPSGLVQPTGHSSAEVLTSAQLPRLPWQTDSSLTTAPQSQTRVAVPPGECLPTPPTTLLAGDFDVCSCGDARRDHHDRTGRCLVCAGSVNPLSHCPRFDFEVGQ